MSRPAPEIILEAKDIYFRYEKKDGFVLQGASLQIRRGEIVALLGDNGTGKSTLLLHFAAILKPEKGMVEILGKDSRHLNSFKLAGKVGVVFQNPNLMLFRNTVNEEVEFGPRALKFSSHKLSGLVSETLKALAISNLRDEIPLSLSNGQRLRVATASIASMQPEIFLLDEPTQGQDRVHVESLMNYLKMKSSEGAALLFITHNLDVALRYADRILFMNGGRIVENV
ncbi:MAG: ABC transporter ATP-binding protein [Deltaproteobacteria bacterium]|nr:ABC transporter ATP-binding protein [Deltaproteobacteria bacterium]